MTGEEGRPAVMLAQGGRDEVKAVVMAAVEGGLLRRPDMCMVVPRPGNAIRRGEYPA